MTDTMRQKYRELTVPEANRMYQIKDIAGDLHDMIDECGESRELSLAKTNLEQAVMWAVKHITG